MITVEHNADGTSIVRLSEPIKLGELETTRVTIPALRGKHMRRAPWIYGQPISIAQMVEFAAFVVLPEGAIDEMDATDARDVALEVMIKLGKHRATGEAPSPT